MTPSGPGPSSVESGGENRFDSAYRAHFGRVRGFLQMRLGNAALADDLTQDTFLHLWTKPNGFDGSRGPLRTYLLGVAQKKAADWWRRQSNGQSGGQSQVEEVMFPATGSNLAVQDALARLPPELREILWLREVEGLSYGELSQLLKLPLGTVKSRLYTAREQLRQIWHWKGKESV